MLKKIYKLYENEKIMVPGHTFREQNIAIEHGKLLNEKFRSRLRAVLEPAV